jgi:redox-sensitive bicupin YhaK (pirin superfamily)
VVEVTPSRVAQVGALTVRRALPRRARRTVGAWCFADHMGPVALTPELSADIGPHPHIGLQTVTWLLAGELLHHDSLGSEQLIRPGQLNLMTAGHGVVHAEESTATGPHDLHGVQLWVAQPERTRHAAPAFEHHAELPRAELGPALATVLIGELAGARSSARHDTDGVGADLVVRPGPGPATVPLQAGFEHALVVTEGAVAIAGGTVVEPGHLAYLGAGRDEIVLSAAGSAPARTLLLGGVPFEAPISMWWNFVARDHAEIDAARQAWEAQDARFGPVASGLGRIPAPPVPWATP